MLPGVRRPCPCDRAARFPADAAPCCARAASPSASPACGRSTTSSLALYAGEVTALIGENGAGKSTLVKILTGIYQPDEGEIVDRRASAVRLCLAARCRGAAGITAIHQETVLFDDLTVAENIFIGHTPRTRLRPDRLGARCAHRPGRCWRGSRRELDPRCAAAATLASPSSIWSRSPARCPSRPRVVIMDEPTAALSHKRDRRAFRIVEQLKAEGKAILFISHKFDEIFRIADRYTVLRDGELVGEGLIAETTERRAGAA